MANVQGRLIVDTNVMVEQAEKVRKLGMAISKSFQEMKDVMEKTKYYWIGEAGDLNRKLYQNHIDEIDNMLKRILEHPDDLEVMAGNYDIAEKTNTSTSQGLDSDVIE